jgi:hypothetical protein
VTEMRRSRIWRPKESTSWVGTAEANVTRVF